jgi:hypothetical protein
MAVKKAPSELKKTDLVREYKSCCDDTREGLDQAALDFNKPLIEVALETEKKELLQRWSYEYN